LHEGGENDEKEKADLIILAFHLDSVMELNALLFLLAIKKMLIRSEDWCDYDL